MKRSETAAVRLIAMATLGCANPTAMALVASSVWTATPAYAQAGQRQATPVKADAALPFPGYGPYGPPSQQLNDMAGMATMPGMDMSGGKEGGMKMGGNADSNADMKPLKMAQLQEEGAYVATGHENWKVETGFGKNAGMVGMMSQMMVGGSGMEGMKMPVMKMDFGEQNYTPDPDDADAGSATSGGSMPGSRVGTPWPLPGSRVGTPWPLPGMSMSNGAASSATMPGTATGGTESSAGGGPAATTSSSARGNPASAPSESMPGMSMPSSVSAPAKAPAALSISGSIANPKSGDNGLSLTVMDAAGAPVTGAKITASVAMTSMDMGTSHPTIKEVGAGKYQATVSFGMSGPWRVTVKVTAPGGGQPQKKSFDFNAK